MLNNDSIPFKESVGFMAGKEETVIVSSPSRMRAKKLVRSWETKRRSSSEVDVE
jgi:hypothetical protein